MWVIRSRSMIGRAGLTRLPSASMTFTPPKAGMVFASGSSKVKRAFLEQRHQRDADDWLGHRVEPENRVGGHWRARLLVAPAELACVHDFAAAGDQRIDPGVHAAVDVGLHGRTHALEAASAHSNGFRRLDSGVHGPPLRKALPLRMMATLSTPDAPADRKARHPARSCRTAIRRCSLSHSRLIGSEDEPAADQRQSPGHERTQHPIGHARGEVACDHDARNRSDEQRNEKRPIDRAEPPVAGAGQRVSGTAWAMSVPTIFTVGILG